MGKMAGRSKKRNWHERHVTALDHDSFPAIQDQQIEGKLLVPYKNDTRFSQIWEK